MGQSMVTSDLFYDLVSIQYHALKGQEVYTKFCEDARGQQDIVQFFEQVKQQDVERAQRCHELLTRLSQEAGGAGGGGGEPYPNERTGQGTAKGTQQTAGSGTRR